MPPKSKDGVRNRKKGSGNASNGEGDGSKSKSQKLATTREPKQSNGGMTCLNWFIVLFLIIGASGGVGFFIHNEMKITNRALLLQISNLKSQSSDVSGFKEQLESISDKLKAIEKVQEDIESMKQEQQVRSDLRIQLATQIKQSQEDLKELSAQFSESAAAVNNLKVEFGKMQSSQQSQSKVAEKTDVALRKMNDLIEVSNTNVASLNNELMRFDKQLKGQFEQISSVQKEVIDLTADKVAMSSAMDSMKTTIVSVRDKVQQQSQQDGAQVNMESVQSKIQEMDKRMSGEIERLSRQISETSENSAKWLQQSTNELGERFQRNVEELNKQLSEFKAEVPQTTQATDDESLVNSIAALDARLNTVKKTVQAMDKFIKELDGKRLKSDQLTEDELAQYKDSLAKLADGVVEVKSRDDKLQSSVDGLTSQVTKLSNELNGIKSVARILETRVEEIRTGHVEEPPKPAEPDQPEQKMSQ